MRKFSSALTLLLLLASCGPSDFEKQKLAFEQQKYKDEQAAKAKAAQDEANDKKEQKDRWVNCRVAAQAEFESDMKTWGEPVPGKPGIRNGPANQLKEMKDLLQRQNEQCDRNFPKGISW
jgi:hypothetical protein